MIAFRAIAILNALCQESFFKQVGIDPIQTESPKAYPYSGAKVRKMRTQESIPLRTAVRVKRSELWRKLGEPMQAMRELQRISHRDRRHPWAMKVWRSVYRAV